MDRRTTWRRVSDPEELSRLRKYNLMMIIVTFVLIFALLFIFVERISLQNALLNFCVFILIVIFSILWRIYFRDVLTVPITPISERTRRRRAGRPVRRFSSIARLPPSSHQVPRVDILRADHHHHLFSESPASSRAAQTAGLPSYDGRHSHVQLPQPEGHLNRALIVHVPIVVDNSHIMAWHQQQFVGPDLSQPNFRVAPLWTDSPPAYRVSPMWPDSPPSYHVALDLPVSPSHGHVSEPAETPPPSYDSIVRTSPQ